jgi:hypothetical protein
MLETALSMSSFLLLIMAVFDFSYMTYVKVAPIGLDVIVGVALITLIQPYPIS